MKSIISKGVFLIFTLALSCTTHANIVINGTRVVYPAEEKEISVKLNNKGTTPILIQAWIDKGDQNINPDDGNVPFFINPPMNRVNAGKGQTLRISYTGGETLPQDRESVFWLNVLEIPPNNIKGKDSNKLQVAFRSRIKLFYRPAQLKKNSAEAAESIKWKIDNGKLTAINNSPYHVTLLNVRDENGKTESVGEMISPFSQFEIKSNKGPFIHGHTISWSYINDWGAIKKTSATI
ncbi:fimbrial biogenesis chaperone [Enterobacter sp. UPMP2060]